jgi:hypothetical protein
LDNPHALLRLASYVGASRAVTEGVTTVAPSLSDTIDESARLEPTDSFRAK